MLHSDTTSNTTEILPQADMLLERQRLIFVIIDLLLIIPIGLGNLLVLYVYKTTHKLQVPYNLLLVNLATSDLIIGCVTIPLTAVTLYSNEVVEKYFSLVICIVALIPTTVSCLTLLVTAIFRFVVIVYAKDQKAYITKTSMHIVIATLWAYSVGLPVGFVGYNAITTSNWTNTTCHLTNDWVLHEPLNVLIICQVCLVLVACTVLYFIIGVAVVIRRNRWAKKKAPIKITYVEISNLSYDANTANPVEQKQKVAVVMQTATNCCNRLDCRTIGMLTQVLIGLYLSWMPLLVTALTLSSNAGSHSDPSQSYLFRDMAVTCLFLGTAFNPWFYAYKNTSFRDSFRKIVPIMKGPKKPQISNLPTSI